MPAITLKVADLRAPRRAFCRIRFEEPPAAFEELSAAILEAFGGVEGAEGAEGMEGAKGVEGPWATITYADEEGDVCALDGFSFSDFLSQQRGDLWRLTFCPAAPPSPPTALEEELLQLSGPLAASPFSARAEGLSPEHRLQLIHRLSDIHLRSFQDGRPRALVLECCSQFASLRVAPNGRLEATGATGLKAVFFVRIEPGAPGRGDGWPVAVLESAAARGTYVRLTHDVVAEEGVAVDCMGRDPSDEACQFELVGAPIGEDGVRASALRSFTGGASLAISGAGAVYASANPSSANLALFIFRLHPEFDEVQEGDPVYAGRRIWCPDPERTALTFPEVAGWVRENTFRHLPHGEVGVAAAKLIWVESVPEAEATPEALLVATELKKSLTERRPWPDRLGGPRYTFSEFVAFYDARVLGAWDNEGSLAGALRSWDLAARRSAEIKAAADAAEDADEDCFLVL